MRHTTGRIELRKRPKNVIMDILEGYSKRLREKLTTFPGKTATRRSRVLALCKTILLHAIRIITCVVEWTTSLFISFLLCKINVCRFVCIYLIFDNFIFILLLSDINLKNLVKGVWLCPSLYDMCKHQKVSIKREKKDIYIPLKRTKKKEKKESKMKINTVLVGEKVPENRSCPPFFLAFCMVYSLLQGQIYIVSQIKSGSTMSCFIHLFMSGWLD